MNPDNQSILSAILGTGAAAPPTLFNTGTFDTNNQQTSFGGQLPQMGNPLDTNMGHMGTMQRFFSGPQSTFGSSFPQAPQRHTPGRDSWSSGMGLGHQDILNNIGLGGQQ